jgi:hypothetical protein
VVKDSRYQALRWTAQGGAVIAITLERVLSWWAV